jgi:hypothetical protein
MADVSGRVPARKRFRLLATDGSSYESEQPGTLGGNRALRIYGRLNCGSAISALPKGYARHRVFFADEAAAIAAGYRPCGNCLRERYRRWKQGGVVGSADYPCLVLPDANQKNPGPDAPTNRPRD